MKNKKLIYLLMIAFMFGTVGQLHHPVKGEKDETTMLSEVLEEIPEQPDKDASNYIVMTNEKSDIENTMETVKITENTAEKLQNQFADVIIEEDFNMTANTTENIKKKKLLEKWLQAEEKEYAKTKDSEWNIRAINAEHLAAENGKRRKPKVAVLDSGIDFVSGIDLAGSVNLVEEENTAAGSQDLTGHGTGIASVIAGNADNVIQGVNPHVDLYSVKVLDKNNGSPISRIIQGIYWCIEHDINIINMSFSSPVYSVALEKAVKDAYEANILMIGAVGNHADRVEYPAAFDEVMAVAATNPNSELSSFSNTGEELDIAAPGEKIKVLGFFGLNGVTHGTSIAVPQVVGAASLLWQRDLSKSNDFIRNLMVYSAKKISGTDQCGLLDAKYALDSYDDFSKSSENNDLLLKKTIPQNTEKPKSFDSVNDEESYAEGRWGGHDILAGYGLSQNKVVDSKAIAIIKAGSVYPDKDKGMLGSVCSEYHGDYRVNYIACYEYVTRIAQNNGKAAGIPRTDIYGLSSDSYGWIKMDFTSSQVGSSTWGNIFSNIKVNNVSVGDSSKHRMYFTWGIALHILQDTFAHGTYRKFDGKRIVDGTPNSSQIGKGDEKGTVPGRWKAAELASKISIYSMLIGAVGDYYDIDYALKNQTYTKPLDLFLKKNLLKYAKVNSTGLTSAETKRFKAANKD